LVSLLPLRPRLPLLELSLPLLLESLLLELLLSLLELLLLELLLELLLLELLLLLRLLSSLLRLLSLRLLLLSLRLLRLSLLLSLSASRRCAWAVVEGDKAVTQSNSRHGAVNAPVSLLTFVVLMACLHARPASGIVRAPRGEFFGGQQSGRGDAGWCLRRHTKWNIHPATFPVTNLKSPGC